MVALRRKYYNKLKSPRMIFFVCIIVTTLSAVFVSLLWIYRSHSAVVQQQTSSRNKNDDGHNRNTLSYSAALTTIRCLTTPGCFRSLQCRSKSLPRKIQRKKKWEEQAFCIDDLRRNDCLVYSFGIHDSWEWEEKMAKLFGCKVWAFDPTQNYPKDLAPGVTFYSLGLEGVGTDMTKTHGVEYASIPKQKLRTLDQIMKQLGHTKLDVLMLDCEGCEWGVLRHMWCTDRPPNVDQMVIEMHFQKSLGLANEQDVLVAAEAILCMIDARLGITSIEQSGADRRDSEFYARDVSTVLQDTPTFLLNASFRRIQESEPLPHKLLEEWAHHSQVWFTAREKCLPARDKLTDQKNLPPDVKALCDDYIAKEKILNRATKAYRDVVRLRAKFDEYERYDEPA